MSFGEGTPLRPPIPVGAPHVRVPRDPRDDDEGHDPKSDEQALLAPGVEGALLDDLVPPEVGRADAVAPLGVVAVEVTVQPGVDVDAVGVASAVGQGEEEGLVPEL